MAVKAVEMTRSIRDKHYEETKHLPVEEQLKAIKEQSEKFRRKLMKPKMRP